MPREILVPVDERSSIEDVDRAIELAEEARGRVTVLGLEGRIAVGVVPITAHDARTAHRRHRLAVLERAARAQAEAAGVALEVVRASGPPTQAIIEEARRRRADAVVVGGSPASAPRWARGRSARRLRRATSCPVWFADDRAAAADRVSAA
jgi:nucleotide-binding universal stress UspA family protein